MPFCSSPAALPVLFRLWRGKGTASQVELAAEMMKLLAGARSRAAWFDETGDAAFHGESLIVEETTWTTRLSANAVLYGLKPEAAAHRQAWSAQGQRDRMGTCAQIAAQATLVFRVQRERGGVGGGERVRDSRSPARYYSPGL